MSAKQWTTQRSATPWPSCLQSYRFLPPFFASTAVQKTWSQLGATIQLTTKLSHVLIQKFSASGKVMVWNRLTKNDTNVLSKHNAPKQNTTWLWLVANILKQTKNKISCNWNKSNKICSCTFFHVKNSKQNKPQVKTHACASSLTHPKPSVQVGYMT